MSDEIVMPRLSDTMEEGTIARWLKREGEPVHKGDPILEIQTDKATMELEAYSDGAIAAILVDEGSTVAVGTVVGMMASLGETTALVHEGKAPGTTTPLTAPRPEVPAPLARLEAPETPTTGVAAPKGAAPAPAGSANGAGAYVKASPLARNVARAHAVDLHDLAGVGSGPGGRIVRDDVDRYLARVQTPETPRTASTATSSSPPPDKAASSVPAAAPAPQEGDEVRAPSRLQQIVARRLSESKATVPHFYVASEIDMAAALDLRRTLIATFGDEERISVNDLIVKACALALRARPDINTSWRDGQYVVHAHVNVGIAVDVPAGLVVPVIHDADRLGLRALTAERKSLVEKARAGKLAPRDIEGGVFTVSNLGMYDVDEFQAIINPPESAILAVGSIVERAVVVDGAVVVRPRMRMNLSVDHRVVPGVPAAEFMAEVKRLLQEPLRLGF